MLNKCFREIFLLAAPESCTEDITCRQINLYSSATLIYVVSVLPVPHNLCNEYLREKKGGKARIKGKRGYDRGQDWEMSSVKEGGTDVQEGVIKSSYFSVGVFAATSLFFLRPARGGQHSNVWSCS